MQNRTRSKHIKKGDQKRGRINWLLKQKLNSP